MNKSILFIIGTLDSGGVAKSIVNLLNAIDRKKYNVHLLVMSDGEGPYGRYIPKEVNIHRDATIASLLKGLRGLKKLFTQGHYLLVLCSLLRLLLSQLDKSVAGWLLAHLFPIVPGEWDVIVDFNGQQQLYYMVDKLKGKTKVTFFHNDYHKWSYYEKMDRQYYLKVDKIFSVSEQCVQSLKEVFPEVENKIGLFYNISLPEMIFKMAEENVLFPSFHGILLVTIGHICYRKGTDLAIDAAKILKRKGVPFHWIFVGPKTESEYEKQTLELGLNNEISFVGMTSNPYPYMKAADIIVHTSRYEGKSIALDEAKVMCKPIVVTNFSTVRDQFEHGINASICRMDGESIANSIGDLVAHPEKRAIYSNCLNDNMIDNRKELQKIYELF